MNKDATIWQGRSDIAEQGDTRRMFQTVKTGDTSYGPNDAVLLGFACDAGVKRNHGRPGARTGPVAIRKMLANLPVHEIDTFWDAGDIACNDDELEQAQALLADKITHILDAGSRPVVLGGGHEVAWGSFQGLAAHLAGMQDTQDTQGKPSILIVNLDAHFDLRTNRPGSSGTPFDQILEHCRNNTQPIHYACFGIARTGNTQGLFDHAQELGITYVEDTAMQESHLSERLGELDILMAQADLIHLTIDLDVLPAAVAPGVSAPSALGVPFYVVEAFANRVKASGKLRLAEIAEMNPDYDIDNHTARAAARLAWGLLSPWGAS